MSDQPAVEVPVELVLNSLQQQVAQQALRIAMLEAQLAARAVPVVDPSSNGQTAAQVI